MSYLKMALRALEAAVGERGDREAQTTGIPDHVPDHAHVETPQASPPERTLTCYECGHFSPAAGPNPAQSWGTCQKRRRGRFGVGTACGAILNEGGWDGYSNSDQKH